MKATLASILIAGVLIVGAVVFSGNGNNDIGIDNKNVNNVNIIDGKQIVEIDVLGGGYSPKVSYAKAGLPTILRMKTSGFFSCAGALSIPAMSYRANLPLTGVTDIEMPVSIAGTKIKGLCAMGMYSFVINFES